nr:thioredoxin domain-containing protein [Rhizobium sp. CCGE532]
MQPVGRADRPIGSASAPVTVIEYSSPTCPHCVEYRTHVALQIEEEVLRTGTVMILFRPTNGAQQCGHGHLHACRTAARTEVPAKPGCPLRKA